MCFGNINLNLEVGRFSTKADFLLYLLVLIHTFCVFFTSLFIEIRLGEARKTVMLALMQFISLNCVGSCKIFAVKA